MSYKIFSVLGGYKVGLSNGGKLNNGKYYFNYKPLTKPKALQLLEKMSIKDIEEKNKKKYLNHLINGKFRDKRFEK